MDPTATALTFTKKDRDLIRLEFMDRFGSATSIHDGFWIRRWATGPNKGQPKISPVVQSRLDRGLVRMVEDRERLPRVLFTEAGLRALVKMTDDIRAFRPPERYSNLLAEIAELRQTRMHGGGRPREP
jgi:hypothetical protein